MARSHDGGDLDVELVYADAAGPIGPAGPAGPGAPGHAPDTDDVLVTGGGPGLLDRVGVRLPPPPHRWSRLNPRWRRAIAVAGAGAILLAAVVAVQSNQPAQHRAAPHPTVSVPAGPSSVPSLSYTSGPPGAPPPGEGFPVQVPPGHPLDLAISDTSLYVLLDDEVVLVDAYGSGVERAAAVQAGPYSRLVLDEADGQIWVISEQTNQGVVHRFDTATLTEQQLLAAPGTIYDAVTLDGRLFIATSLGIEELAPGAIAWTPVTATNPPAQVLLADSNNDTVYALTSGPTGGLIAISSDGNRVVAGPTLEISQPSLALVGSGLWVGGVGPAGLVTQVDPTSMRPLAKAVTAAASVGAGAEVEPGANDIWVYSPYTSRLYCMDLQTGQELQHWDDLSGPVTAGGSGPFAIGRGEVIPLVLRGACRG